MYVYIHIYVYIGVTLGGTGKHTSSFDRHPKLGNSVFLGCQCTILGNITIGDNCTVGSGSLVLKALPNGATAVGSPALIKYIAVDPSIGNVDGSDDEIKGAISLWAKGEYWLPKIWQDSS
jgi:serine O-acetyltransferase